KFARHVGYFYHKCLHVPAPWFSPPGNQDYRSLTATLANPVRRPENPKELKYRDFVDRGYVIAGSPATGRDRLKEEAIKGLRVGNLMVLLQIGSGPHQPAIERLELCAAGGVRALGGRRGGHARGAMREQTIAVWQKQVRLRVLSQGSGPALVFFHGSWGLN